MRVEPLEYGSPGLLMSLFPYSVLHSSRRKLKVLRLLHMTLSYIMTHSLSSDLYFHIFTAPQASWTTGAYFRRSSRRSSSE